MPIMCYQCPVCGSSMDRIEFTTHPNAPVCPCGEVTVKTLTTPAICRVLSGQTVQHE